MTVIKQGAARRTEENHRWQWGCERDPINGHTSGLRQPWVTQCRSPQAGCGFWCSVHSRCSCSWTGCWTSVSSSVRWELWRAPSQGHSEREELSVTAGAIDQACWGRCFLSLMNHAVSSVWDLRTLLRHWHVCGDEGVKRLLFQRFFFFF